MAVWRWAPVSRLGERWTPSDQGARGARFCRAYRYVDIGRVIELLPLRIRRVYEHIRERAESGDPGFTEIWAVNHGEGLLLEADYVEAHFTELTPSA
jgi:hypothetical protein